MGSSGCRSTKDSRLAKVKKATAELSNPQYFLDTIPEEYSAEGYILSFRCVHDESAVKRLQDEWRNKLIPMLQGSNDRSLQENGARLEKIWRNEKRRVLETVELTKDEHVAKTFKQGMKHAFQHHQLTVMEISSRRFEKDLTQILDESLTSDEYVETLPSMPPLSTEKLPPAASRGMCVDTDGEVNDIPLSDTLLPPQPASFDDAADSFMATNALATGSPSTGTPLPGAPLPGAPLPGTPSVDGGEPGVEEIQTGSSIESTTTPVEQVTGRDESPELTISHHLSSASTGPEEPRLSASSLSHRSRTSSESGELGPHTLACNKTLTEVASHLSPSAATTSGDIGGQFESGTSTGQDDSSRRSK
ncbi:hypothetical protein EMPS_03852 [Entomortierella parvispora]|uniref:Uncharacterized protein n=1 Tax=Entomortierella parvispora TaxID=205924 RepID=A0A9P3H7K2_9FUNG|nr:hypothetical protein EMPS_03852 [Entomortierella parvispora]